MDETEGKTVSQRDKGAGRLASRAVRTRAGVSLRMGVSKSETGQTGKGVPNRLVLGLWCYRDTLPQFGTMQNARSWGSTAAYGIVGLHCGGETC